MTVVLKKIRRQSQTLSLNLKSLSDDFELEYWTRKHFKHCRARLLPDPVRAADLCSPHPVVISHAINPENIDHDNCIACERPLKKIMVPGGIAGTDKRERTEAKVINTF